MGLIFRKSFILQEFFKWFYSVEFRFYFDIEDSF